MHDNPAELHAEQPIEPHGDGAMPTKENHRGHPWWKALAWSAMIALAFVLLAPGLNRDYYYKFASYLPSLLILPFVFAMSSLPMFSNDAKPTSMTKAVGMMPLAIMWFFFIFTPHMDFFMQSDTSYRMEYDVACDIIENHQPLLDAVVAEMMIPEPEPIVAQKPNPLTGLFDRPKPEAKTVVIGEASPLNVFALTVKENARRGEKRTVKGHPSYPKSANMETLFSLGNFNSVVRYGDRVYFNNGDWERDYRGWFETYFYYAPDDVRDEPNSSYALIDSNDNQWVYETNYTGGRAATGRITVTRVRPFWFYYSHMSYDKNGNPL